MDRVIIEPDQTQTAARLAILLPLRSFRQRDQEIGR